MLELHTEGGIEFMVPLSILFLIIIVLTLYSIYIGATKGIKSNLLELTRQLGIFALVFGMFGTTFGLFHAFRSLSEIKEALPPFVIYGGMKVAMINALYGAIIFMFATLTNVVLRYFFATGK